MVSWSTKTSRGDIEEIISRDLCELRRTHEGLSHFRC